MSNIDLSLPVWCGGEEVKDIMQGSGIGWNGFIMYDRSRFWEKDGTPLGDWLPLTNEPPTPEVDERGEEVKALLTRISELKGILSLLADKAYYEDSDFGRYVYNLIKYI